MSNKLIPINRVSFIGSGSWASALAIIASNNVNEVVVHTRAQDITDEINNHKANQKYIGDIVLPGNISAETGYFSLNQSDLIAIVTPVSSLFEVKGILRNAYLKDKLILICSKGIDSNLLLFPSEILNQEISDQRLAVLSGPNFAKEVASSKITKTVIASSNLAAAQSIANIFTTENFYPVINQDIIGVQICGALKNVIAIAVGVLEGLGLGENFRAALICDGLDEISKLIEAYGGNIETAYGIAGMGDLVLTCGSLTSRNVTFGYKLARGEVVDSATIVEGVNTARALYKLANKFQIKLPISEAVYKIIYEKVPSNDLAKLYLNPS